MTKVATDQAVAEQYEAFPYPLRDPADEAQRLLAPPLDMLARINHYCFAGRLSPTSDFRVLVAGGGTGDAAIYLAHQLALFGARVVYLDPSHASRSVAQARAQARDLNNIDFHTGTIESLPTSGLGPFDYINCTGVLHHLADPLAGLQALSAVLKPTGAMGLMVYGAHGRRPTTDLRAALAPLVAGLSPRDAVATAVRLLDDLPEDSLFYRMSGGAGFLEALKANPPEVADLLLHPRETAYDVQGIFDLVQAAELSFCAFSGFMAGRGSGKAAYMPDSHVTDPTARRRLAKLSFREQAAFSERFSSSMALHAFYVAKQSVPLPSVENGSLIPYMFAPFADDVLARLEQGGVRAVHLKDQAGNRLDLTPGPDLARLLRLFDGSRDFDQLVAELRDDILKPQPVGDMTRIARQTVSAVYELFNRFDWMLCTIPDGLVGRHPDERVMLEEVG